MNPLLFAMVDAVLRYRLESALVANVPLPEYVDGVESGLYAFGWWRSTWEAR